MIEILNDAFISYQKDKNCYDFYHDLSFRLATKAKACKGAGQE
jgi:hypothetical protein